MRSATVGILWEVASRLVQHSLQASVSALLEAGVAVEAGNDLNEFSQESLNPWSRRRLHGVTFARPGHPKRECQFCRSEVPWITQCVVQCKPATLRPPVGLPAMSSTSFFSSSTYM